MELQDAVSQAIAFAKQALPHEKLTVEEVEHDDSPPTWRITLGFKRALPEKRAIGPLGATTNIVERWSTSAQKYVEFEDVYKLVSVPEDGGTPSMKIRKV